MLGILIFEQVFLNLGEECRNRVLGNIFGITDVSVSDIFIKDDEIVFRLFSKGVFYQYIFKFGNGDNELFRSQRIINRLIFISNYIEKEKDNFIYLLVELFRSQNEYQIYQLMKNFL